MEKKEFIEKMKKALAAVEKLPDEFKIASVKTDHKSEICVRVDSEKEDALYRYASMAGLYCKTVNGEYDHYDGIHILDENGTEIYEMVNYQPHGSKEADDD